MSCFLRILGDCDSCSDFPWFWWPWQSWGILVRYFSELVGLSDDCLSLFVWCFFLAVRMRLGFVEEDDRDKVPFSPYVIIRVQTITMIYHWWYETYVYAAVVFALFSYYGVTFLSLFMYYTLWKEITVPIVKSGELCCSFPREQYVHKSFGMLLYKRFWLFSLIYLFKHLFIWIWTLEYLFYALN